MSSQTISSSAIEQQFRLYADELKSKQDDYERIYKNNRDITIESKRIICLLHTANGKNTVADKALLRQAHNRLHTVIRTHFREIATLIDGQDPYRYIRAYKCGIQEFIEALVLFTIMECSAVEPIPDWDAIQSLLTFDSTTGDDQQQQINPDNRLLSCHIPPLDYILGVADVSGELLRRSINSLSFGNFDQCKIIADQLRAMYIG